MLVDELKGRGSKTTCPAPEHDFTLHPKVRPSSSTLSNLLPFYNSPTTATTDRRMAVTTAANDSSSIGPSETVLLPGQPIPVAYLRDPKPTIGKGCYEHGGRVLCSVIGRARRDGQVCLLFDAEFRTSWQAVVAVACLRVAWSGGAGGQGSSLCR